MLYRVTLEFYSRKLVHKLESQLNTHYIKNFEFIAGHSESNNLPSMQAPGGGYILNSAEVKVHLFSTISFLVKPLLFLLLTFSF